MNRKHTLKTQLEFIEMILLVLFCIQSPTAAGEQAPINIQRKQIVAVRVETPPKIDGILDEAVWQNAQPSEGFTQTHPDKGKPMNQRTVVYVLYDNENIYLGFQCYDSEPKKVIGTEMRRDYEVWQVNDYIRFVLDTYQDLRTAYYFGTNPLGAQVDARVTGNGFHKSWDAVWDCAARPHSQGWSAEFHIPFRQLRFPAKENHVWGFNCARTIRRDNEEGTWSSIPTTHVDVMSGAGEIIGLRDIPQGHRLEFRPAIVGGAKASYNGETAVDSVREPSLDIKYGLTSGLTLDATVNTDFAQVEADPERVNLSRFDLFFEEKRPFFLEGVGIFSSNRSLPLFYSRTIGSADGVEVPILGGLKLTGKVGAQSVGLLSVQADETDETPSTNFSAFRVQRDILRSSSAGILLLNKAPFEDGGDNQTLGLDFQFNPRQELNVSTTLAKTWTEGQSGKDLAGQVSASWESRLSRVGMSLRDLGENFNAEMGFVRRTNIRSLDLWGSRSFLIRKRKIRSVRFGGSGNISSDHDGQLLERRISLNTSLELETGDTIYLWVDQFREFLDADWEIREGVVIPTDTYQWNRYGVWVGTDERRSLRITGSFNGGEFYNGDRRSLSLGGHIRPVPELLITGDYNRNLIDLPDGSFTTNTVNSRSIYSFSPDFFMKLFLQWNDASDIVRGNFLIRYTYQPGSDLYIVYNQLWRENEIQERSIVAKVVYFLNL